MSLFSKHAETLEKAIKAIHQRSFYAHFAEHPKAYGEQAAANGKPNFEKYLQNQYTELLQTGSTAWVGTETSPYTGNNLEISYPTMPIERYIDNAKIAFKTWQKTNVADRAALLIEALINISNRFHEIAWATMHTTGQSFVMSFQASGPHAADRALEAIAMGYYEQTRFPQEVWWEKPMGKATLKLQKNYFTIPKGIGLVIGCSTFPTWNTVPGLFANLVTGNVCIVKPHPKAILPIAIFVAELQKTLHNNGFDTNIVQLAVDEPNNLITKQLAEHPDINLIDYTGGSSFGNYIEKLPNKTVFTEKAGINSVIIESTHDLREVMRNIAFSVSLYSGQMCTAPQNIFISETGVIDDTETISYEQAVDLLRNELASLALNPNMGAGILGAIQNPTTMERAKNAANSGAHILLNAPNVNHAEFPNAQIAAPTLLEVAAQQNLIYEQELFGPIVVVVKTKNIQQSISIAKQMAKTHGAITCCAYTTNTQIAQTIENEMNSVFAPVSLNFTGAAFVNQHATFSDFHVTGGNPAGNASFTDSAFITRRFVWVGNRKMA